MLQSTDWIALSVLAIFWALLVIDYVLWRRRTRRKTPAGTGLRSGLSRLTYRGEHRR